MSQERVRATRNLKKQDHYGAALSLYVAHYNLCRVHESLRTTPAIALGVAGRVWAMAIRVGAARPDGCALKG